MVRLRRTNMAILLAPFCTKAFGMARPLSRGLAILVVVGLKGAMVLCVNMPFWLQTFVTS